MKKEFVNGKRVPHDAPMAKLKLMLASPIMMDFVLACEALSERKDREAYELLKKYINDKDKYRRLYILKTIFRHPQAIELKEFLESAINSDDFLFVSQGLLVLAEHHIKISEALLVAATERHLSKLYTEIRALHILNANEANYKKLTELLEKAETSAQKEFLCEVLIKKYLPEKAKDLFDLLGKDRCPKLRLCAVTLGKKYGFDIYQFEEDPDGHVRKAARSLR
jgi:hypothetical protein